MIPVKPDRPRPGRTADGAQREPALSVLGSTLTEEQTADDGLRTLALALQTYVHAVADAVGVPHDATMCEVTDTVTAYLALSQRRPEQPEQDLMLVWSERQGWAVAVETKPAESPVLLARLGEDPVPHPETVARFVTDSIANPGGRHLAALPAPVHRLGLAKRMEQCAPPQPGQPHHPTDTEDRP
jgi:hypothetical protein